MHFFAIMQQAGSLIAGPSNTKTNMTKEETYKRNEIPNFACSKVCSC